MSDIAKAIETVQDMLDTLETAGSCYAYKHNGGQDRLRNVLNCLRRRDRRWIPVAERLPEIPEGWMENPNPVFFVVKGQEKIEAGFYGEGGTNRDKYFRTYRDRNNGYDVDDVTCWMWQSVLPEPPENVEGVISKPKCYRCIKQFAIDRYDEDGFWVEEDTIIIEEGMVFKEVNNHPHQHNIVAASPAVHLENENGLWIEIYPDTLTDVFEEVTINADTTD